MKVWAFMDEQISKNEGAGGYALPFSVHMAHPEGGYAFFYADSLAGIKEIIRNNKKRAP